MNETEKNLEYVLDWFIWLCRNTTQEEYKAERYRRYNDLVWSLRKLGCSVTYDFDKNKHKVKANALK